LIPTSDEFVQLSAKYHEALSKYCLFLIPQQQIIHQIIERDLQFNSAIASGLNVPSFVLGRTSPELLKHNNPTFPLALKPINTPEWKRKINNKGFVVHNNEEFNAILKLITSKNNVRYLIQSIIEGDNYYNFEVNALYFPNGRLVSHTIRKLRQYPDRFGTATCIESFSNPEVEKLAEKYIRSMNLVGFTNMEFKYNKADGQYYYIETNTRVWLQVNFSMKLGINFPMLYYNYLTGNESIKTSKVLSNGKWVDFLPDLLFWKIHHQNYNLSFIKFIKSWFPILSTGLFSLKDPKPFVKDFKFFHKITNIIK